MIQMYKTKFRTHFAALLSATYLWLLISPFVSACTCDHSTTSTAPAQTSEETRALATDCCAPKSVPSCCITELEVSTTQCAVSLETQPLQSNCCLDELSCLGCPDCQKPSVLLTSSERTVVVLIPDLHHPTEEQPHSVVFLLSQTTVDDPPDLEHIARHLASTVLRC